MNSRFVYKPSKPDLLPKEVLSELLTIPKIQQKSEEWFQLRKTLFTASSIASIIPVDQAIPYWNQIHSEAFRRTTPNVGEYSNPYSNPHDFMESRLGLKPFTGSKATLHGERYEDVAEELYKRLTGRQVYSFGTIISNIEPILGASPDGIDSEGIMLEIKSPYSREIIEDFVPIHYWIQTQIQMFCCHLKETSYLEIGVKSFNNIVEFQSYTGTKFLSGTSVRIFDGTQANYKYIYTEDLEEIRVFLQTFQESRFPIETKYFHVTEYNLKNIPFVRDFIEDAIPGIKEYYKKMIQFQKDPKTQKKGLRNLSGYSGFI